MFEFDPGELNRLTQSQRRHILLEGREIFVVFAAIIFTLGLMIILGGEGVYGMWFILLAMIIIILSSSRILFMSSAKQDNFILASLVQKAIRRTERKTGQVFSEAERDRIRFRYDPLFHQQIIEHSCKHVKQTHDEKIARLTKSLTQLQRERSQELERLRQTRWRSAGSPDLIYSLKDGQIRLNKTIICNFAEIQRVYLTYDLGERYTLRIDWTATKEHLNQFFQRSKSLLDDQLSKRIQKNAQIEEILPDQSTENIVPCECPIIRKIPVITCGNLSVRIKFNDHTETAIVVLPNCVDWASKKCHKSYQLATHLEQALQLLSKTPMPVEKMDLDNELTIQEYDQQISDLQAKLHEAENSPPQPEIPERYLFHEAPSDPEADCINTQDDVK